MSVLSDAGPLDGRYDVGGLIGKGAMGEVRRAYDRRLHRDVAIKFLRPDLAAQPTARERFEREARSASRLTHPNVVLVLDSGEADGVPYLVMECLPGRSLRDELKEGPLPPARATWIARDVLAGLAAAHEIGIVHRDVSPANILMTETGQAKIADFGIAQAAENPSVTVVGQVLGTPAYVAPERLHGEPATPAADVYGVGAVLYEAVSGQPPFTGDSALAVAQQAASTRPERLEHLRPDVPLDLVAAVDLAMDPDPARRPSAEELRASLAGDAALSADTSTIPIVDLDAGASTTSLPVEAPMATIAAPAVAPTVRRRTWQERRILVATAGFVALIGLLLLGLSDHAGSRGTPANAEVTTTVVAPSTTVAPPTTAASSAVVLPKATNITRLPAHHHHKGKG